MAGSTVLLWTATALNQHTTDHQPGEQLALFAPPTIRERVRDLHAYPMVGTRTDGATGDWRYSKRLPAETVWRIAERWPYVQLASSGRAKAAVILDCDDGGALWEVLADWELPPPSWTVWNERGETRSAHVAWCLEHPIYTGHGARFKPQQSLARFAEYSAHITRADAGYAGLLTRNPCHEDDALRIDWGRSQPYPLSELLESVPTGFKKPTLPRTGEGRNCRVFEGLRKWAYKPRNWQADEAGLRRTADQLNRMFDVPLSSQEVGWIVSSVRRWVQGKLLSGEWTAESFAAKQAARGRKSKRGPDPESARSTRPWEALGVSMQTYYRRGYHRESR